RRARRPWSRRTRARRCRPATTSRRAARRAAPARWGSAHRPCGPQAHAHVRRRQAPLARAGNRSCRPRGPGRARVRRGWGGGVGEREYGGLGEVRAVAAVAFDGGTHGLGAELAGGAGKPDQLEPAAEKFRRAAFVDRDMGAHVAEHGAPRRRRVGERKRIGGGAGGDQKHGGVAPEKLGDAAFDRAREVVIAVAEGGAAGGAYDRVADGGRGAGRIIAGKVHRASGFMRSGSGRATDAHAPRNRQDFETAGKSAALTYGSTSRTYTAVAPPRGPWSHDGRWTDARAADKI